MNGKIARTLELLAIALFAVGWLLFMVTRPGKIVMLMLVAVAPSAAWLYARTRMPKYTWVVTGSAFGFVVYPFSRGLESLIYLPELWAILGVFGWLSEAFHGLPGYLVMLYLNLELQSDTGPEAVFFTLLTGVFWATVYGCLGFILDRDRPARSGKR